VVIYSELKDMKTDESTKQETASDEMTTDALRAYQLSELAEAMRRGKWSDGSPFKKNSEPFSSSVNS